MDDTHPFFARRWSRHQLVMLDVLAGMCFSFVFLTSAVHTIALPPSARLAIAFGLGLPLAMRRLWPLSVFCLTLVLAVFAVMIDAVAFAYVAPAYALYVVALSNRLGPTVPTLAIGVVSLVTVLGMTVAGTPAQGVPEWMLHLDKPLMGIAALGGAWTVGRAVQERRYFAARDAERMAAQAVTEERLRIARELHDVVTHSVGLIAVKAGVANHVMASKPEEAHDALRVIETASRSALVEMRHLLGMLRSTNVPDLVPVPGVAGIQGLVEQARLAGVETELDVRTGTGDGVRQAKHAAGKQPSEGGGPSGDRGLSEGGGLPGGPGPFDDGGLRGGVGRFDGGGLGDGVGRFDGGGLRGGLTRFDDEGLSGGVRRFDDKNLRDGVGRLDGDGSRGDIGRLEGAEESEWGGLLSEMGQSDEGPRQLDGVRRMGDDRLLGGVGLSHGTGRSDCGGQSDGMRRSDGAGAAESCAQSEGSGGSHSAGRPDNGGLFGGVQLSEGVGLSVYRIVQEALTNAVKHAAPARCRVSLVADDKEVLIEVVDDGPGRRTLPSDGAGHGLIGMRERVMMYGGAFEAGSLPGRGFRVFARLPYGEIS
ncbi:histidine kinase [Nonomuraea sp. NPDC050643]|uniref:histidine kinase n=1 Tax=Nonomuraea sp. NPDC050643 TaxID=3155660 RepID=UPI0033F27A99